MAIPPFVAYPPTQYVRAPGREMFEAVYPAGWTMPSWADLGCHPGVRVDPRPDGSVRVRFGGSTGSLLGAQVCRPRPAIQEVAQALPHFQLRPVQLEAVTFLLGATGALLELPVGSGKTRTLLGAAKMAGGRTLIVGLRMLAATWRSELVRLGELQGRRDPRWSELRGFLPDLEKTPEGISEAQLVEQGLTPEAQWVFTHPELVWSWDWALRGRFRTVIVDEAHLFRNPHTRRYLGVRMAAHNPEARHVWLATGTKLVKKPREMYSLLDLALPGAFGPETAYRVRYLGAERGRYGFVDGDLTHQDELAERTRHVIYSRSRAELGLELPSRTTRVITHVSSDALRSASERVLGANPEFILNALLLGRNLGPQAIQYISALRARASREKVPTTVEHVASLVEQDETVVVFVAYRETAQALVAGITKKARVPVLTITGQDAATKRRNALEAFLAFDAKVLVATFDVLGVGVNLQGAARCVVHHDLTWVPATHAQATGRVWRSGQTRGVLEDLIYAEGTLDEILARALSERIHLLQASGENVEDYQSFAGLVSQSDVERWFANK